MDKIDKLKLKYNNICDSYIKEFEKKHGYEFSSWTPNQERGGIACFIEQYFFNFEDIVFDINNRCEKELIFRWQDDSIDSKNESKNINFKSYNMGLRFEDLK